MINRSQIHPIFILSWYFLIINQEIKIGIEIETCKLITVIYLLLLVSLPGFTLGAIHLCKPYSMKNYQTYRLCFSPYAPLNPAVGICRKTSSMSCHWEDERFPGYMRVCVSLFFFLYNFLFFICNMFLFMGENNLLRIGGVLGRLG